MTIKEAFELLADAARKGMKNPLFFIRNLTNALIEISEKI